MMRQRVITIDGSRSNSVASSSNTLAGDTATTVSAAHGAASAALETSPAIKSRQSTPTKRQRTSFGATAKTVVFVDHINRSNVLLKMKVPVARRGDAVSVTVREFAKEALKRFHKTRTAAAAAAATAGASPVAAPGSPCIKEIFVVPEGSCIAAPPCGGATDDATSRSVLNSPDAVVVLCGSDLLLDVVGDEELICFATAFSATTVARSGGITRGSQSPTVSGAACETSPTAALPTRSPSTNGDAATPSEPNISGRRRNLKRSPENKIARMDEAAFCVPLSAVPSQPAAGGAAASATLSSDNVFLKMAAMRLAYEQQRLLVR